MYCSHCGAVLAPEAGICGACGRAIVVQESTVSVPVDAGFWKRFAAVWLDYLILCLPMFALGLIVALFLPQQAVLIYVLAIAGCWLYFALQESSRFQATLGKRAVGIRVVNAEGQPIDFGRATARYVAALLNYLTLGLGYALAGWTTRKQGLHDMVAGTRVMNRPGAGSFPVWLIVVLALIGLGIPVLGILAAIAIPAYADYTQRVHVAEGLNQAAAFKLAYSERLYAGQGPAMSAADIDMDDYAQQGRAQIQIEDGLIIVRFNDASGSVLSGEQLALEPLCEDDCRERVHWVCGYAAPPRGAQPLLEVRAAEYTSLAARYLPAACR